MTRRAAAALLSLVAIGCSSPGGAAPSPAPPATTPLPSRSLSPSPSAPRVVTVPYQVEIRTRDRATANFRQVVDSTLADPRGWSRAGFRLSNRPGAPYLVVIAEAPVVDRLCRPYRTFGKYSCQNGPVVAINADRWRRATPEWTGDLATYRVMLVNHEVGHLLGRHHPPEPQCPVPGRPALVMAQQSTELDGCLPNPWPLPEEIAAAAKHDEPLAPPYEGPTPTGSAPAQR